MKIISNKYGTAFPTIPTKYVANWKRIQKRYEKEWLQYANVKKADDKDGIFNAGETIYNEAIAWIVISKNKLNENKIVRLENEIGGLIYFYFEVKNNKYNEYIYCGVAGV